LLAQDLKSGGEPLAYQVAGDVLTAYTTDVNTPVFTLTLGGDGTGTLEMFAPIDNDGPDALSVDLSSIVLATDGDGDQITLNAGSFTFDAPVNPYNDAPVIDGVVTGSVAESGDFYPFS